MKIFLLALVFLTMFDSHDAEARRPRRGAQRRARSCNCSSGIVGVKPPRECKDFDPRVQKMYEEQTQMMLSCCRPQANQEQLRKCYEGCKQPGRAGGNTSNHIFGRACDVRPGVQGKPYGLINWQHHGAHHVSTTGR